MPDIPALILIAFVVLFPVAIRLTVALFNWIGAKIDA